MSPYLEQLLKLAGVAVLVAYVYAVIRLMAGPRRDDDDAQGDDYQPPPPFV